MKLLLTSAGFTTPDIVQACAELCGKPANQIAIAVINEAAAVEPGDKRWFITELERISQNFGGQLDIINLLALTSEQIRERLAFADVIYMVGGHTDYLVHLMRQTGFDKLLTQLLKTKVYVGSSAGGMIMGSRISTTAYQEIYGEADDYGVTTYLELADVALKPHLDSPIFPANRQENLVRISQGYDKPICGLRDTQAIQIVDETTKYIGGPPLIVKSGTIVV